MDNLERYDLSDWLIHFTRPLDPEKADVPQELPFEWGFDEEVEEGPLSPFFLLRRILRKRQILSTWSFRKGRPTVYGPHPAVCFTEMPLAAFLDASRARSGKGENVSPYAVLLKKADAYSVGARPVIYGLSGPRADAEMKDDGTRRLAPDVLPEIEQYRYVVFDPTASGKRDWSHEREWRWPNRRYPFFKSYDVPDEGASNYEAFRIWDAAREEDRAPEDGLCLDSGAFSEAGFLVKSQVQANFLTHDILALVDGEVVPRELFTFILRHDALPARGRLLEPREVAEAIEAATIHLEPYFKVDAAKGAALRTRFDTIVGEMCEDPRRDAGEFGGCWLWLRDNTHALARALLAAPEHRHVQVSRLGRYLVSMPELGDDRGLRLREELTKSIAERVVAEFGTPASYFSVLNSDDPNRVPFYTDVEDDEVHLNRAHKKEDF